MGVWVGKNEPRRRGGRRTRRFNYSGSQLEGMSRLEQGRESGGQRRAARSQVRKWLSVPVGKNSPISVCQTT